MEPNCTITVRISARAKSDLQYPIVGFMMRNHLGMDFSGTNTAREGLELPAMSPGEILTVDFYLDIPELYATTFSFSPAVADGALDGYAICDWIDNAIALQMTPTEAPIYGLMHLACRVEVRSHSGHLPVTVAR